jgi:hypothetical protein
MTREGIINMELRWLVSCSQYTIFLERWNFLMFNLLLRSSSKPSRKHRSYLRFNTEQKTHKQSTLVKRIKYYIPSVGWIPNYSLSLYVLRLKLFSAGSGKLMRPHLTDWVETFWQDLLSPRCLSRSPLVMRRRWRS